MTTIGIRLANAVLFVLSCSVASNVITDVSASVLMPDPVVAAAPRAVDGPTVKSWEERQVILDRNLFGAQVVVGGTPADEAPPDEDIDETDLPLKLLGTIASGDQHVATAAIENTSTRQHEVVKVGDSLTGHSKVSVERIERGRIVLLNGAKREELTLDENAPTRVSKAAPTTRQSRRAERRQARRARKPRSSVQDRLQELTKAGGPRGMAALLSEARVLPKYENGSMVGIELSKIKEDSFYQKAGLSDGDIVTSVNGVPINNPSASSALLGSLKEAGPVTVEYLDSNGNPNTLNIPDSLLSKFRELE